MTSNFYGISVAALLLSLSACSNENLAVSIQEMQPYWKHWNKRAHGYPLGIICKRTSRGVRVALGGVKGGVIRFGARQEIIHPVKHGSKIVFIAQGKCSLSWVNGIRITPESRLEFKVDVGQGLVYAKGKGTVLLKNGTKRSFGY